MTVRDEILEEVRAAREAYAARFNCNLAEIYKDPIGKEKARERNIAQLRPIEPRPEMPPTA